MSINELMIKKFRRTRKLVQIRQVGWASTIILVTTYDIDCVSYLRISRISMVVKIESRPRNLIILLRILRIISVYLKNF